MPLQVIPLDQSIYGRPPQRSAVSEALTPQRGGVTHDYSFLDRERAKEEAEAQRKYQEKIMKMQHEQGMEKARFTAGLKEDEQRQQTTMGNVVAQAQQQGAQRQQIEDNPEEAADEMWKFYLSLPEENQKMFINQMFTPTSTGSTVSSPGKTVQVGGQKYNAIAQNWIDKGRVMFDDKGNITVHEPTREFEEGTFKLVKTDKGWFSKNTATGEMKLVETIAPPKEKLQIGRYQRTPEGIYDTVTGSFIERFEPDNPEDESNKTIKLAHDIAMDIARVEGTPYRDGFYDALLGLDFTEKQAKELAEINEYPKEKKSNRFIKWFKGEEKPEVTEEGWQPKGAGAPTYREGAVTALISQMEGLDTLTATHYSHWEAEGATREEINEAFRRAKGEK